MNPLSNALFAGIAGVAFVFAGEIIKLDVTTPESSEFPAKLPTFGEPDVPGWTRVNAKGRHRMPARVAMLCITPPPEKNWRGDHTSAFTEVFVNDTGKAAMFSPETPIRFPEGSTIIKVKYPTATGGAPLLRTVMVKRAPGYNPDCGDWEFIVTTALRPAGSERGKIRRCMDCHDRDWIKKDDHTFRHDYLPAGVLSAIEAQKGSLKPKT